MKNNNKHNRLKQIAIFFFILKNIYLNIPDSNWSQFEYMSFLNATTRLDVEADTHGLNTKIILDLPGMYLICWVWISPEGCLIS